MNSSHVNSGAVKIKSHVLGYPRVGAQRQLKWALENYWAGNISQQQLVDEGKSLRVKHWQEQLEAGLDFITTGDFAFYDQVLNQSCLLGVIPKRFSDVEQDGNEDNALDTYFRMARGRSISGKDSAACEMTKWFDTNYHYIVPEFEKGQTFKLNAQQWLAEIQQAQKITKKVKPVIIGPLTYLWLGKTQQEFNKLELLPELIEAYGDLLHQTQQLGVEWLQIDEPILALDLPQEWKQAFETCYNQLNSGSLQVLLATYFGDLKDNLNLACQLPVAGLHLDGVRGSAQLSGILDRLPPYKILSLGIINGRNIWAADLNSCLEQLKPFAQKLKERLWVSSSCSLLHVPHDIEQEEGFNTEVKSWFSFAKQKLSEISALAIALSDNVNVCESEGGTKGIFKRSQDVLVSKKSSPWIHDSIIQKNVNSITPKDFARTNSYNFRAKIQKSALNLPLFPTTTIGSFPQTSDIRKARREFKQGGISQALYEATMKTEIARAVIEQENLGLDVLVHGEAERNDMVEYFGQQLQGYLFSQLGWVQSYGSRCVKPPIIAGDISRKQPMTVKWSEYAQSLTTKPMKGMLTGPITMLCWSFTRDDISEESQAYQLALALAQEVKDLEQAGIHIIQVDEPALREGLPLRKNDWQNYLRWAVDAFRLSVAQVQDSTQIHTHMCYAEFNDIIQAISDLDADVITIETSRSNMELLQAFKNFDYPNDIGPGVYDIHSPLVPTKEWMVELLKKANDYIPAQRLWVNPDCGLKTRAWPETQAALKLMVAAASDMRASVEAQAKEKTKHVQPENAIA